VQDPCVDGLPARYLVEAQLDGNKNALLYLVRDRMRQGSRLVLKMLPAGVGDGRADGWLKTEFETVRALRHPNVVCLRDFGHTLDAGIPYFTQDFVEGTGLSEACEGSDLERVCLWSAQTCLGLHFLHIHGVVHGDVKPEHILVGPSEEQVEQAVRLIDFGMSSRIRDGQCALRGGTVPYMAPEVADGEPADRRADIYSLGMTLLGILARRHIGGEAELDHDSRRELLCTLAASSVPSDLSRLVERMTAPTASDRYSDLTEAYRILRSLAGVDQPWLLSDQLCVSAASQPCVVDRRDTLDFLIQALHDVRQGTLRWQCILLSGEEGIGKSRLADELQALAQLSGLVCAKVTFGSPNCQPFQPFDEAIRSLRLQTSQSIEESDAALEGAGAVEEPMHGMPVAQVDLYGRSQALRSGLSSATTGRQTAMIFENLHLADPEELRLWAHLVRSLGEEPFLVCGTYRDEGVATEATCTAADLASEGRAVRLELEHLSHEDAKELAEKLFGVAGLSPVAVGTLNQRAGGNPLYLRQLISHLLEKPADARFDENGLYSHIQEASVPASMRGAIRRRISSLDASERECLSAIAVLNRPSSVRDLQRVCAASPGLVADAFRGLFSKGIVRPSSLDPERFEIEHSEHQEVLCEETDPAARRDMHRRAGHVVEEELRSGKTDVAEEAAEHFLKAGIDDKASAYCLEAARRASRAFAYDRASKYYRAALERTSKGSGAYFGAADGYANVCYQLNRHGEAIKWFQSLLQYPLGSLYRGNIYTKLGASLCAIKDFAGARGAFCDAKSLLDQHPGTRESSVLNVKLLADRARQGRPREALRGLLELRPGLLPDDADLRGYLFEVVARTYQRLHESRLSQRWYKRSGREYRRAGHILKVGQIQRSMGHVAYEDGRYSEAASFYQRALTTLQPYGPGQDLALTLVSLGNVAHVKGDLHTSARRYTEADQTLNRYGRKSQIVSLLNSLALVQLCRGHFARSLSTVRRALRLHGELCDDRAFRLYSCQALIALSIGDADVTDEALGSLEGLVHRDSPPDWRKMNLLRLRGLRELEFGSASRAMGYLQSVLGWATEHAEPTERFEASLCLARALGMTGPDALRLCTDALRLAEASGSALWRAEATFWLALAYINAGKSGECIELLLDCAASSARSGMKDLCWRAHSVLAGLYRAAGKLRYAASSDEECVSILHELREDFVTDESWISFISVAGRREPYVGLLARVRPTSVREQPATPGPHARARLQESC